MGAQQLSLLDPCFLGGEPEADDLEPGFDPELAQCERIELGRGAWIEHVHGWVRGRAALFDILSREMRWRAERRVMYEREVDVPRLLATVPEDGPLLPVIASMSHVLSARYEAPLDAIMLALYRHGGDSVAWHRDHGHRDRERCVVAVASLGGPRRFLVRPLGGGASRALVVESGDLVVMGGSSQRTFEHCVPKTKQAEPRIAIMFRHVAAIAPKVPRSA